MNQPVNLQALVEALATKTSTDTALADKFIHSLVDTISSHLAERQHVSLPGIGTFAVEEIGGNTNILWQPDSIIADEVNSPFASFEPVVLAPEVTDDILNATAETTEPQPQPEPEPEPQSEQEQEKEQIQEPEPQSVPEPEPITETLHEPEPVTEPQPEPEQGPEPETIPETDYYSDDDDDTPSSGSGWWIFTIILAAVIGYLLATYLPNPLRDLMTPPTSIDDETELIVTDVPQVVEDTNTIVPATDTVKDETDTIKPDRISTLSAPTATDAVVTDTVRQGRFLATMARRHYGSYKFWVYIYLENAGHIPNPNNLPVGTVLVIPPASKYNIDAHDPASIARAEAEIKRLENR